MLHARRPARRSHRNAPEGSAGRDVKRLPVQPAEGAVGHLIDRYRDEVEELARWREDVDAALELRGGFVRRVRLIESRRHVEPALAVSLHAVRTAAITPVEYHFAAVGIDGAIGPQ